ncbi:TPA: hypothetical protein ACF2TZ_003908 [Klebsiella pneumoniae]|uniref:hypothetical protein n=1 Tax=Klebsiella pneumoniae TaxID=573 RepID=UPI0023B28158|nr:hypothetical protein [Klebsiella pneumoniae]
MTKSTITRERLEWLSQISCRDDIEDIGGDEIRELASMALAAMDSEPVGWTDEQELRDVEKDGCGYLFKANPITPHADPRRVILLYRHAQPAPVVPEDIPDSVYEILCQACGGNAWMYSDALWNAFRAAMLHAGNSPAQSDCCPAQNCIHSAQGVDRPVAWHHSAKSKEGNHGTCCFSYASSHDFGPRYEKPQSQPHYLPERLDYDRALHFLSTEPRKVTPETVIGGNSPVIPDGSADMLRRWLAFGRGMQNAGCQLPHNLIVESEAMLAAAPQGVKGE